MAIFDTPRMGASGVSTGYEIERSLRFDKDSSTYLSRTAGSPTNQNKGTWSCWFKRLEADSTALMFGGGGGSQTNSNAEQLAYISSNTIAANYKGGLASCSVGWFMYGTRLFRDPTAWYHILVSFDWTQSGDSNRLKFYINGVQDTLNSCGSTGNAFQYINVNGNTQYMGRQDQGGGPGYSDHYLAEAYFVDGTVYAPSDFTETDSDTGVIVPKNSTEVLAAITLGNNGGYYNFSDTSDLGKDHSSNSNDFTAHNFTTSGEGTDSLLDTPTNNFCTWNELDNHGNITLSEGNLRASISSGFKIQRATHFLSSGKWYWEVKCNTTGNGFLGVTDSTDDWQSQGGASSSSCMIRTTNGDKRISGSESGYGSGISNGDTMMFALDMDNGKFWVGKNNSWFNSGNPSSGSNAASTAITNEVSPSLGMYDSENYTANFGQRDFSYTPPSGFEKICSANMSTPAVKIATDHFEALTYSGNGSQRAISGLDFAPDVVWIKRRNSSNYHIFANTLAGANNYLVPNTTDAESTGGSGLINGFNSDGFDIGTEAAVNNSSGTYVAWNWNCGGSTATNNDGDIQSSVRANPTAGMSIVHYTGNGSNNTDVTVGHGLGTTPAMVVVKSRDGTGSKEWLTFHKDLDDHGTYTTYLLYLNDYAAQNFFSDQIKSVQSSTFTLRSTDSSNGRVNKNGEDYFAWCFAEVEGFSKFGQYIGNGNSDGTFIYLGFRPAYFVLKGKTSNSWYVYDNKRDTMNPVDNEFNFNNSQSEASSHDIDFTANGVKMRTNNSSWNYNNYEYVYMAFAEHPYKYSRAY